MAVAVAGLALSAAGTGSLAATGGSDPQSLAGLAKAKGLTGFGNAIGGVDLGKLHETVEKEFLEMDESEKSVNQVMSKLETSFIQSLEKFRKE